MDDLIEALAILHKYDNGSKWPTHCEHDILIVVGVDPEDVSLEDTERLDKLGFMPGPCYLCPDPCFYSFRFGSA